MSSLKMKNLISPANIVLGAAILLIGVMSLSLPTANGQASVASSRLWPSRFHPPSCKPVLCASTRFAVPGDSVLDFSTQEKLMYGKISSRCTLRYENTAIDRADAGNITFVGLKNVTTGDTSLWAPSTTGPDLLRPTHDLPLPCHPPSSRGTTSVALLNEDLSSRPEKMARPMTSTKMIRPSCHWDSDEEGCQNTSSFRHTHPFDAVTSSPTVCAA